jgi:uncharacterized membrane protein YbjE (DUF340 family)
MLKIILIMFAGIGVGLLLRNRNIRLVQRFITVLIWALLFLLGVEVGGNRRIIDGFRTLGIEAAVLTFFGVAGSVLLSWLLWTFIRKQDERRAE